MMYKCEQKGKFDEPNAFGYVGICPSWNKILRRCNGGIVCSSAIESKAWKMVNNKK